MVWNHGILRLHILWIINNPIWRTPSIFRGGGIAPSSYRISSYPDMVDLARTWKGMENMWWPPCRRCPPVIGWFLFSPINSFDTSTRWCPPSYKLLISPLTIDISPINHSYWRYVHQLSYRTGAPPCKFQSTNQIGWQPDRSSMETFNTSRFFFQS